MTQHTSMRRRALLQGALAGGLIPPSLAFGQNGAPSGGVSVEALPGLAGALTVYLGRGEGGLYEDRCHPPARIWS